MIRFALFIILSIWLLSCSRIKEKPHPEVLSEPKLVAILVDYHLAQGLSSSYTLRQKLKAHTTVNLTDSVLAANGCSRAMFDSTLSFYARDVNRFNRVYDKVLNELSKMQAKAKDTGTTPTQAK